MSPKKKKSYSFAVAFGTYGAVGFQLAITVVGGLFLGSYCDKKFDSSPWFTVLGLLLGSIGGFYNLIRILEWKQKKND